MKKASLMERCKKECKKKKKKNSQRPADVLADFEYKNKLTCFDRFTTLWQAEGKLIERNSIQIFIHI